MRFTLTIDCDNDAFGESGDTDALQDEIASILTSAAQAVGSGGVTGESLHDSNGNVVGRYELTNRDERGYVLIEFRQGRDDIEIDYSGDPDLIKIDWDDLGDDEEYAREKAETVRHSALPTTEKERILNTIAEVWKT